VTGKPSGATQLSKLVFGESGDERGDVNADRYAVLFDECLDHGVHARSYPSDVRSGRLPRSNP